LSKAQGKTSLSACQHQEARATFKETLTAAFAVFGFFQEHLLKLINFASLYEILRRCNPLSSTC
jgi:hypothetical protein